MDDNYLNTKIVLIPEGKISDYIDGTFRNDTPEEYVRQTIEKRLVSEHKYPKSRIKVEYTLQLGSRKPRADIAIFPHAVTDYSQGNIQVIVECKRESVEPNNKKEGIGQLKSYMSACPNCEWGMWTNGKYKDVFRKVIDSKGKVEFVEYNDIPSANGSVEDIDRPKRDTLKRAVEDNMLFVFKTCHNHIYATDGLQKQPAFFELLKVIFCKIEDEKNVPQPLQFYTTSKERSNPDGQLTVQKRISKIFESVKKKYSQIFDKNDEIKLQPRSLAYIVSELQKYNLLDTNIDIKGKAYEELVGANLRGDRGEFFTPRNIMHMLVDMIVPKSTERVLDPACGTGGFLVTAMNKVIDELKEATAKEFNKPAYKWTDSEQQLVRNKISEVATTNFFGFDINPDLVKATKMNMVMNNDGYGNIFRNDSLLPPHEWSEEFKSKFADALKIHKDDIAQSKKMEWFDVAVTNPPFGSQIPIKDPNILEQFDLGYIWEKKNGGWSKTNRLQSSVPPEQLFIERCLQFLKPDGRLGIVLPDSILGSPSLGYIRQWIIGNARIVASLDLHGDTFQPGNGTQTSILILQKKSKQALEDELKSGKMKDYPIFMSMVDRIGHDKRGNPLFKRDKYGNELLVPETSDMLEASQDKEEVTILKTTSKVKVIDDQTTYLPQIFSEWKIQEGIEW
jgi:type I restriction enzyme M protein